MNCEFKSSKKVIWTGRVISTLITLMMGMSVVMKIKGGPQVTEGFAHLGLPPDMLPKLIILEGLAVLLYAIPTTSVIGAILMTGYMGGAICTHLRMHEPVAIQSLIPVFAWLGIYLRDEKLRGIIPLRCCKPCPTEK